MGTILRLSAIFILFFHSLAYPCSGIAFGQDENWTQAFNFWWSPEVSNWGLLVSPRHVKKTAVKVEAKTPALQWTSIYGSLSFTNTGYGFGYNGVNEKGLVAEVLLDLKAKYPSADGVTPAIAPGQLVQYILDTAKDIDEAIVKVRQIKVVDKVGFGGHYFICDISQRCAILEFINEQLVVHEGKELRSNTITNSQYDESVKSLDEFQRTKKMPAENSLQRYVVGATFAPKFSKPDDPVSFGLFVLGMMLPTSPQPLWNAVYRLSERKVYFRSGLSDNLAPQNIALDGLNFSCLNHPQVQMLNKTQEGDVKNHFENLSRSFQEMVMQIKAYVPPDYIDAVMAYPDTEKCLDR